MSVIKIEKYESSDFDLEVDWKIRPSSPNAPLLPVWRYNDPTAVYKFNDNFSITISIERAVYLSCCKAGFFNYDLNQDESVLLGDNIGSNLPIHLVFDPPISALGAYGSADTTPGEEYQRLLAILPDDDQSWQILSSTAPVTRTRGAATFMGATATGNSRIKEMWFDMINIPGNSYDIRQVGIGTLYVKR